MNKRKKYIKQKMVILCAFILGILIAIYIKTLNPQKVYITLEEKKNLEHKIEIENNHNFYELNLQLAFLHLNNENMSYAYNNKLKNKIKDLLLSNSTIEKSFEMGNLKFNIKLIYTKEYINFYKGKRKIIFN